MPTFQSAGSYQYREPPSSWEDIKDLTPAGARLLADSHIHLATARRLVEEVRDLPWMSAQAATQCAYRNFRSINVPAHPAHYLCPPALPCPRAVSGWVGLEMPSTVCPPYRPPDWLLITRGFYSHHRGGGESRNWRVCYYGISHIYLHRYEGTSNEGTGKSKFTSFTPV